MIHKEYFKGSYKTSRGSYKEFRELVALFFSVNNNNYKVTRETFIKEGNKINSGDFMVICKDNKIIYKIDVGVKEIGKS